MIPRDQGLNGQVHCPHYEGLRCRQLETYPTGSRTMQCDKILQVMDVKGPFKSTDGTKKIIKQNSNDITQC